jgi:hypothetical protein
MLNRSLLIVALVLAACGGTRHEPGNGGADGNGGGGDGNGSGGSDSDYTLYAHSDTVLYTVDLQNQTLVTIGPFNAPGNDTITDLAVAPSGTIYVISETVLYTASATTGTVTQVGTLSACGSRGVALTTTPDGSIWEGDYKGALCKIDISQSPPVVGAPVMMGSGMALTGDFVAVDDGTVFGTAYDLSDPTNMGTQANNVLVKLDLTTGAVTTIGATGFPELFGTAYQNGKVFGFTHDGTGRVVTIDTTTGAGTLFGTFMDPQSNKGIAFAGAGVSSLVPIF